MTREFRMLASVAALCFALSACGGGGGGGVASTPPAPPPPPPPPPPSPPPPVAASQSVEFATIGDNVAIRYDSAADRYEVELPGQTWAELVPSTDTDYVIRGADGTTIGTARFSGSDTYSYTGVAGFSASTAYEIVYGIATPASGVPVTGSASYSAEIFGGSIDSSSYSIGGTAQFDFNFATGSLSGFMKPSANDPGGWGPYDLGQFNFVNTIYSKGSTSFSGGLSLAGGDDGSFSGKFTGPQAQELMGQWQLSFKDIYYPDTRQTVHAAGLLIGKKGP